MNIKILFILFLFFLISCNKAEPDNQIPEINYINIEDGQIISSNYEIKINISDNDEIKSSVITIDNITFIDTIFELDLV